MRRLRIWLSRRCQWCGGRKPLWTAVCDECWQHYGEDHALRLYDNNDDPAYHRELR
jgi:hypothetical protein